MKQQIDVVNYVGGTETVVIPEGEFDDFESECYLISDKAQAKLYVLAELFERRARVEKEPDTWKAAALVVRDASEAFTEIQIIFDRIAKHRPGCERARA
jgi:hypothetical protein